MLLCTLCMTFTVMLVAFIYCVWKSLRSKTTKFQLRHPVRTLIVMGSGGHTTEMMTIAKAFDRKHFSPRIYVMADTDLLSPLKVMELEGNRKDYWIERIHRVREVGQSWTSTFLHSVPITIFQCYMLLMRMKPKLIMLNGPGICVPICLTARICELIRPRSPVAIIVYVESICRVKKLSLTGSFVQPFVDRFIVQWSDLVKGGRIYLGRIS